MTDRFASRMPTYQQSLPGLGSSALDGRFTPPPNRVGSSVPGIPSWQAALASGRCPASTTAERPPLAAIPRPCGLPTYVVHFLRSRTGNTGKRSVFNHSDTVPPSNSGMRCSSSYRLAR